MVGRKPPGDLPHHRGQAVDKLFKVVQFPSHPQGWLLLLVGLPQSQEVDIKFKNA
jgi:hypothetical protein